MNNYQQQNEFEKERLIVSDEFAEILSVSNFMLSCEEDEFDDHERMLIDIYKHLENKWVNK